jgi:hypothetical protein
LRNGLVQGESASEALKTHIGTDLIPLPDAIMLLKEPLKIRNTVLALDKAVTRSLLSAAFSMNSGAV